MADLTVKQGCRGDMVPAPHFVTVGAEKERSGMHIRDLRGIGLMLGLTVATLLVACGGSASTTTTDRTAKASARAGASTSVGAVPITLRAADGTTVYGALYAAPSPKAVILLFHQAGSSKDEYATIAPRLVKAGYTALAIDQRSGGDLFGPNQTAAHARGATDYLDAKADLQAALDWAVPQHKPVILWGSSYSSALVFLVAAENPGEVAAVMAFSPGEYLGAPSLVRQAASHVDVPVFVTSARNADEIAAAQSIVDALMTKQHVQFVPKVAGVHGSSTLIAARNKRGEAENWAAVNAFLAAVAP